MTHDENYKLTTSNYSKTPNPIISPQFIAISLVNKAFEEEL